MKDYDAGNEKKTRVVFEYQTYDNKGKAEKSKRRRFAKTLETSLNLPNHTNN